MWGNDNHSFSYLLTELGSHTEPWAKSSHRPDLELVAHYMVTQHWLVAIVSSLTLAIQVFFNWTKDLKIAALKASNIC